jgi:small-conductance mechanosensitive channel
VFKAFSIGRLAGLLVALVLAAGIGAAFSAASAQTPSDGTTPRAIVSADTKAARAKLDAAKAELDQKEAALRRPDLGQGDLQSLRQQIDPVSQSIRDLIAELGPKLDDAKARLDQLGPKPEEEDEGSDVARDRGERETAVTQLDETQRLARALLVQSEQLTTQISDRRRASFARALFERSSGLLSPDLWTSVATTLPRDFAALNVVAGSWMDRVRANSSFGALALLGLSMGLALALYVGRRHIIPRLVTRDPAVLEPSQRHKLLAALGILLLGTVPAVAGSFAVYAALKAVGFLPQRLAPVAGTILGGLAFVAFAQALLHALIAPERPTWRLVKLSDAAAARTVKFLVLGASLVAVSKAIEAVNQAIAAALTFTVATRGVFAVLVALVLAELLRRFASTSSTEEECLGPYVPTEAEIGGPLRTLGWTAVVAVLGAALVGYVAFASFLVDQIVWLAILAALLFFGTRLVDEFIGGTLKGQTRIATTLQANTGLRRKSLAQIGVLGTGLARVMLITATALLALAPWGVESTDLLSQVRAAFFGFKIGDVTISLSSIAIALALFAGIVFATRVVQRWLDSAYLPATDLDAGLRNSILTVFGYLGFIIAGAVSFSYLGLSLEKIAIVAGALSVGIGFGLQSIVNNFVSGLILLWERPIRVGDLVVVGDGEGHVRRINVRATEIETFDRSTIIVPNSNLISGVVKNRVRGDRVGRVVIAVNVLRNADPARAAELLVQCAKDHADVLREPPPRVFFKKIGETFLEFELVSFVPDVDFQARVQSELNFAVFQRLTAENIIPALGPGSLEVRGLDPVGQALDNIAEAIAERSSHAARPSARRPRAVEAGE